MGKASHLKALKRAGLVTPPDPGGPVSTRYLDGISVVARLSLSWKDRLKITLGGVPTVKAYTRTEFHPGQTKLDGGESFTDWGPRITRALARVSRLAAKLRLKKGDTDGTGNK